MLERKNRISRALLQAIWILTLIAFAFVFLNGLFVSCRIDTLYSETNNERVVFVRNNPVLTAGLLLIFLAVLAGAGSVPIGKRTAGIGKICLSVLVFGGALFWMREAAAVPYADSRFCLEIASLAASGSPVNLSDLSYLRLYPFQAGFVLYAEGMIRMLGDRALSGMQVLNAFWLVLFDLAVVEMTQQLFQRPRITLLAEILLLLFAQPVFLATFIYGTIPGAAFGAAGMYALIRFKQTDQIGWGTAAAVLTGIAVLLKLNLAVAAIAGCMLIGIRMIRKPSWKGAAVLVLVAACALCFPALARIRYELLCGEKLGPGFPRSGHLLMGLSESSMCSGWHNANVPLAFINSGYNAETANAAYFREIDETLRYFLQRPRYLASFFYHKLTSQWNTPSFQGIWSSSVSHDPERAGAFAQSMFYGAGAEISERVFLGITLLIYAGFALSLAIKTKEKECREEMTLIPLTLLGFFLYYALFEAKAQYVILTVPTVIPLAAYAWIWAADRVRVRIRRETEPEDPVQETGEKEEGSIA